MLCRRFLGCLIVVLWALVANSTADAEIVNFTFEGDTVGSMPTGWSETSGYDGNSVTAYVTNTTAGAGAQSFYMDDWAGPSQLSLRTSFAPQSSGLFQLTGMARVEQDDVGLRPFGLLGYANSRFNNLTFSSDGMFRYENGHDWVSTGVAYQPEQWYDFLFLVDMDRHRWSFEIEDQLENPVCSATDLEFGSSSIYTGYFYQIRSWGVGGSGTGQWYIDNIELKQVPEPSTLVLLAATVASLLLLAWRRRRVGVV